MGPDEGLPWAGAPVPKQTGLDVLRTQRLFQQGIVLEINHADGQVIGRAPVSVKQLKLVICGSRDGREVLMGGGRHGVLLENLQSVFGK